MRYAGTNAAIPDDAFAPSDTLVRAAVSICDVAEYCSGTDAVVPGDAFAPSDTLVRASTSVDDCDPAEYCSGSGSDVPADVDNCAVIGLEILGQSGKFTIYDKTKGMASDTNKVTVEMDALREVDTEGNAVGASGSVKHSIQTFAAQSFTINEPESAVIDGIA